MQLKGVASATKKLADGTTRTYYYAWRGGPRLSGEPGSEEFWDSLKDARAKAKTTRTPVDTIAGLIREFEGSSAYPTGASSAKSYRAYLTLIDGTFGTLPIAALKEDAIRGVFLRWRDEMKATPRKADYAWTVLQKLMGFAVDRGKIKVNPCSRGGRLHESGTRVDIVWTEDDLQRLFDAAPWHIAIVCFAALWTGQRQSDVLAWKRSDIRDGILTFSQGKKRKNRPAKKIAMPVPRPLAEALARSHKGSALFLNSFGEPWTASGFRASLGPAFDKAGIDGLRFHDMRGTFSSAAGDAGATEPEISAVTGHGLPGKTSLSSAYLKRSLVMAQNCVRLLEAYKAGTVWFTALTGKSVPPLQTRKQTVAKSKLKCDSETTTTTEKSVARSDI